MATQPLSRGQRTLKRVAADYRQQGYRVVAPATSEALPAFLHDCQPDLIAERDDDHVVVEIKAAGSLKGANELVVLAERVQQQPGWRLELITFKDKDPDAAVISADWLERMLAPAHSVAGTDGRFVSAYLLDVLGFLLRGIAVNTRSRAANMAPNEIARSLAFKGIIDEALLTRIEQVFRSQKGLMRGLEPDQSPSVQAGEIETICRDLFAQSQRSED
jgi:Holliday junction resolvase